MFESDKSRFENLLSKKKYNKRKRGFIGSAQLGFTCNDLYIYKFYRLLLKSAKRHPLLFLI